MSEESRTWIEVDGNGIGWEVSFQKGYNTGIRYVSDRTTKRQIPPEIPNFCCRVCGNDSFEAIYRGPGGSNFKFDSNTPIAPRQDSGLPETDVHRIVDNRCSGCTVHFDDPVKFSKNQPAEVVLPIPTPESEIRNLQRGLPRDHKVPEGKAIEL